MSEKAYKTMKQTGAGTLAVGIVVTGLAAGILCIVNGARLLKNKSDLIF